MVKGKKSPTKQIQGFCVDDGVDETGLARYTSPKSNMLNPKIMGFGKCISGFKHGVILGIYVRCRGANENGDASYLGR